MAGSLSDSNLLNGLVHTVDTELPSNFEFDETLNELKVNTEVLKPRNSEENINYIYLPIDPEIYNRWWKTGIFNKIEDVTKKDYESYFKINKYVDLKFQKFNY